MKVFILLINTAEKWDEESTYQNPLPTFLEELEKAKIKKETEK